MKTLKTDKYLAYVLNKNNKDELTEVQKLRYNFLLKEYNPSLLEGGLDDDGLDDVSDLLVVKEISTNKIVGTYRATSPATNPNHKKPYLVESQYDMSELINTTDSFCCLSRACVHEDYRDGSVIKLLFKLICTYVVENDIKYTIGLCSCHGVDKEIYKHGFTDLYRNHLFTSLNFKPLLNPFSLNMCPNEELDPNMVRSELPSLLRMYLLLGNQVAPFGTIDKDFNDTDVLLVLDCDNINTRFVNLLVKTNEQ